MEVVILPLKYRILADSTLSWPILFHVNFDSDTTIFDYEKIFDKRENVKLEFLKHIKKFR